MGTVWGLGFRGLGFGVWGSGLGFTRGLKGQGSRNAACLLCLGVYAGVSEYRGPHRILIIRTPKFRKLPCRTAGVTVWV